MKKKACTKNGLPSFFFVEYNRPPSGKDYAQLALKGYY